MCYSAQIVADYRAYVRLYGADIDIREFARRYWERNEGSRVKLPKAMEASFADPHTDEERQIEALVDAFKAKETTKLEQDLFKQRMRLVDAERTLQTKPTKAAAQSQRIATDKSESAIRRLDDLRRTELKERDSRISPGHYAPGMVMENGRRVISRCATNAGQPANQPLTMANFPAPTMLEKITLKGSGKGSSAIRMAWSS